MLVYQFFNCVYSYYHKTEHGIICGDKGKKKQREPSLFAGVGVDVGAGCHAGEASLVTTQERNKLTKQSEVT